MSLVPLDVADGVVSYNHMRHHDVVISGPISSTHPQPARISRPAYEDTKPRSPRLLGSAISTMRLDS
jgi:hypothetical protein